MTLYDDQYAYNDANQIEQITSLGGTRTFTYDEINRLKAVSNGETYNYDEVGNRTASHLSTSYTTGAFNRLTATTSATANYNYNNNGSITSKTAGGVTTSYGWDRENRLVSASAGDAMHYKYDALGRRVSSHFVPFIATTSDPPPTRFTHDGLDVIQDDNSDLETTSILSYQNAPGIDNKLAATNNGVSSYFLQDHLSSTVKFTNGSGSVTESNGYDSFGNPTNSSFSSRYQFTGREFDTFSGLQYSRARFYDPQIGRFISEDPIGFAGGINLYAYVGNHPTMFADPFGLFPSWWWPFDYHQQIGSGALHGIVPPRDIESFNWSNRKFDARTQGLEHANMHAMRQPGQSPEDARAQANRSIREKICLAREYEKRGWHTDAVNQIGEAAHTLQDAESPAHSGFQEAWPNTTLEILKNILHYPYETVFYDKDQWKRAENNTLRVWSYFKGYPLPADFFSGTGRQSCDCP